MVETARVKLLIGDVEDGEFWKTATPRAGGLFIHVEDDGWPERMLVLRIVGSECAPRIRGHTRSSSVP